MKELQIAVVLALSACCGAAIAADETALKVLQETLMKRFPTIKVESVSASTWPGVYEVVTANEIIYADAKGEHLIIGKMMDTATRENLTEKRWNDLHRIDFNSLPFDQAIKIVKGDGSRKLAVFEDPFCPFCEELEQSLEGVTNLTLYVFLYPLENLHPGATKAARNIWCAQDKASAWRNWMLKRQTPAEQDCESTPIETLRALGAKLKVNSTPTLFFSDGLRVPGAIDAEQLEKTLTASDKK